MIYRPAKYVAKELRKGNLYRQSAIVHVSSKKHEGVYERMRQDPSHAHESDEQVHERAAYYLVWNQHGRPVARKRKRVMFGIVLLVLILGVWAGTAHCQVDVIQFQQNGTPVTSFAAPFKMNFAGCTLGRSASTITITCSGGTNTPGGSDKQVQYNSASTAFGGIAFGVNGQILESCGTNCIPQFQDPIVSGPTANGVAPSATNPVWIGGWDATNIHALLTDGSGRLAVNVNGTVPVSGTFWQATQPVSGTFWQATQPVSIASMPSTPVTGTFFQVTQPVSIASMPSTPVTGTFFQATQPVSGTVTANQGTSPWVASATLAAETTKVIGTVNQGTSPWVTSATLAAETTKVIGAVRALGNAGATLDAAPAAALPTNAVLMAGRDSTQTGGGTAVPVVCDKSAAITATAVGSVVVIALAASKTTYICGFVITGAGAAGTMQWKSGTGTTCGTGTANLTGAMATAIGGTVSYGNGLGTIIRHASAAQDTCITMATTSATAAGVVSYAQF